MRHFYLTITITVLPCGMIESTRQAHLITSARVFLGLGAR
jgi:hypothetical protein